MADGLAGRDAPPGWHRCASGMAASRPPRPSPGTDTALLRKSGPCHHGERRRWFLSGAWHLDKITFLLVSFLFFNCFVAVGYSGRVFPLLGQSGLGMRPVWFGGFCPLSLPQPEVCVRRDLC